MRERFVGEALAPDAETLSTEAMTRAEPGLPAGFTWRGEKYPVVAVVRKWKEHSGCRHGSGESYLRKHWFHVTSRDGLELVLYFERQSRSGRKQGPRWWLYTLREPEKRADADEV